MLFVCVWCADMALTQPLTEIAIRLTRNGMSHTSVIVREAQFGDIILDFVELQKTFTIYGVL